jgi:hypothetical protein
MYISDAKLDTFQRKSLCLETILNKPQSTEKQLIRKPSLTIWKTINLYTADMMEFRKFI